TELLDALSIASKGLSSRTTLPILGGMLISAEQDSITIQATDLEISIRTGCKANVESTGKIVVPGRLVTDIVRSLPEAAVTIEQQPAGAAVTCGQSSFVVRSLTPDDFPKFPDVTPSVMVSLPTDVFSNVVHQVSKAVSRDETRPVLTGVLVVVEQDSLKMVATDSYRLCVREVSVEGSGGSLEAVVPGRAIEDVSRLALSSERMGLGVSENQVVFTFGETTFVSRRIEGSFPNYRQLLPQGYETRVIIDRLELIDAVKRVSLMAVHNSPIRVKITPDERVVTLTAQTQDIGEAREDLEADAAGSPIEIAFNHAYLADGISVADSDKIAIEVVSPLKPGVIKPAEGDDFIYLLMPVRIG
ncbi:MAG: DNA polymerase III subunit beta, partial [Coriobacteriales bacterium]